MRQVKTKAEGSITCCGANIIGCSRYLSLSGKKIDPQNFHSHSGMLEN
jgi:hypothetical protein